MLDLELPQTAAPAEHDCGTTLRSHVTLALCTLLHAFTHAYGTLLVPLYLLMVADLRLPGVWTASLIVTIYGFVYCAGSYVSGVLADRANRKTLLGIGLLGNAAAILLMGVTRQYELLIVLAVVAGVSGTLFHPCANALVPAHYPRSPGMVIGLLGIGAGLGFFAGPQYAGWRAESDAWHWWQWAGLDVPGLATAASRDGRVRAGGGCDLPGRRPRGAGPRQGRADRPRL